MMLWKMMLVPMSESTSPNFLSHSLGKLESSITWPIKFDAADLFEHSSHLTSCRDPSSLITLVFASMPCHHTAFQAIHTIPQTLSCIRSNVGCAVDWAPCFQVSAVDSVPWYVIAN